MATRAKLGVLAVLAAGAVVWLLVHDFVGHAGSKRVAWQDLAARVGPLDLPLAVSHIFSTRAQLIAFLDARRYHTEPRVPRVDFGRHRLFLVSTGARSSSAYQLRVVRVVEQHNRIVVSVHAREAALSRPGRPRLTFPYALVTVPPGRKPVHTEWCVTPRCLPRTGRA